MTTTPPESAASRAARLRRDAADRARRWRADQKTAAAVDSAIVDSFLEKTRKDVVVVDGRERPVNPVVNTLDVVRCAAVLLIARGFSRRDAAKLIADRLDARIS